MSNSVWLHKWQPTSSPVPGILQARILEWVAISFSNAWKWKVKVKSLGRVQLLATLALLTMPKSLTVWITINCGKFWKRWEYQTTWPASWEICMQVKNQQLELDMEQQTGSKFGKEYAKAVYCHSAYLTYMQNTHEKCWTGWSTSWNQDGWEK